MNNKTYEKIGEILDRLELPTNEEERVRFNLIMEEVYAMFGTTYDEWMGMCEQRIDHNLSLHFKEK